MTSTATPTLSSLKELQEDLEPTLPRTEPSTTNMLRTIILLLASGASMLVAFTGVSVLAYLLATHALTPQQLQYTLPLPLDLNGSMLVSQVPLLQASRTAAGYSGSAIDKNVPPESRFFAPGQTMDIWVDLTVPGSFGGGPKGKGELVHVTAELLSADGRVAGRASQPVLLFGRRFSLWGIATAPLRWLGLLNDDVIVPVELLNNFQDLKDVPFSNFRLSIKARNSDGPEVLAAAARVNLRVGFIRRILYHLRPHMLLALALGAASATAVLGGSATAGICLAMLAYTALGKGSRSEGGSVGALSESSGALSDVLTPASSAATTPRDLEISDDEGLVMPGMSPRPGAVAQKPWQQLLKQLPLGGVRPAPGDDTPFMGSEVGTGSGTGTASIAVNGNGLRQRRGGPLADDGTIEE